MQEEKDQKFQNELCHDASISWKNKRILNEVKEKLTQLAILLNIQMKEDHTVGALRINKSRELSEIQEKRSSPIDIKGSVTHISIQSVQQHIQKILQDHSLSQEEKERYWAAIDTYIGKVKEQYLSSYLGNKSQKYYHKLYKEKKISKEEMYIVFCLVNFLKQYKGTLDEEGKVTEEGLKLLHRSLMETKTMYEKTGKGIGKVFHDGDYMSVLRSSTHGHLRNYVNIIKYLLNKEAYNPYSHQSDIDGQKRRARNKSNFLDLRYAFHRIDFSKKDKIEEFHDLSVEGMQEIIQNIFGANQEELDVVSRIKEVGSEAKKGHGRTSEIRDNSGLRVLYYRDIHKEQDIKDEIKKVMKEYLDWFLFLVKNKKYVVTEIQLVNKNTVSKEAHEEIMKYMQEQVQYKNIPVRERSKAHQEQYLSLQDLQTKIGSLGPMSEELATTYDLMTNKSARGVNGNYRDYKCIIHLQYEDGGQTKEFGQEIQFYNYRNDVGLANHNILDLEKDIFAYCKSNQDMSLDTLRRKTANTIKAMANQTNTLLREKGQKIPEEARIFDVGDGEKISILDLESDTAENNERMRKMIAYIINAFFHQRKLMHIFADSRYPHHGDILPQDLVYGSPILKNRFTTNEVIKSAAFSKQIDAKKYISLYTPEGGYCSTNIEGLIDALAAGYIPCKHRCEEENTEKNTLIE